MKASHERGPLKGGHSTAHSGVGTTQRKAHAEVGTTHKANSEVGNDLVHVEH